MVRILSLVLVFFVMVGSGNLFGQDYFPLKPGNQWHYEMFKTETSLMVASEMQEHNGNKYSVMVDSTPEIIIDSSSLKFEGKTYQVYTKAREGLSIATEFYRKDADGNVYYYNDQTNTESLYIPSKIEEGTTWLSTDKHYQFRIVSKKKTFKSRWIVFEDCLVISIRVMKSENILVSPIIYNYYYDGIGHVGSKTENAIVATLLKWEIQ